MSLLLQHFEIFIGVAETCSFTIAAQSLGVSKAYVSQVIRSLEDSLKLPLFIRSTRSVRLTDEGQLLYAQCQKLQQELNASRALVQGFQSTPTGKLRISSNPYFAQSHLIKVVQSYMKRFPDVSVDIVTEERMPDMQKENIDIVFGINWPAPEDVVAKVIGQTRYILCASPTYLETFGMPKKLKDLETHQYIAHQGRAPENIVVSKFPNKSLLIKPKLQLNNAELMKQSALLNMGVVQLHDYMVQHEIQKKELIEIPIEEINAELPIYIYYQKHRYVQPKIRQFVKLCSSIKSLD